LISLSLINLEFGRVEMMGKEKYRSMFDAFHTEHKNPIRHLSGWVFLCLKG
jgi:hypothetical protein